MDSNLSQWALLVLLLHQLFSIDTAKRILERRGIQTSSSSLVCIPEFKANFSFFLAFIWLGFLSRIYWSSLDHDLKASIWEKAISILVGNLNSSYSYLITAVLQVHYNIGIKNSWERKCSENEMCLQKVCQPIAMCKKCILNCDVVRTIHWFSPSPWHTMDWLVSTRLHE